MTALNLRLAVATALMSGVAVADEVPAADNPYSVSPSQMVQGGVGLWQTPTARMMPEGALSLNYTDNQEYRFWSVSLQLFPWMEATARYTDTRTRLYSNVDSFSGDQTLKDKGLDVKFRLWEESYYLPDISLGFRDFGGTGFFDSEFVNMSKSVGPFDFHAGVGWGYMGTHDDITSPFCKLRDSYCERPTGFSGRGGKVDYQNFFKGPMAFFGGVEYRTPIDGLTLKAEYEGNNYVDDRAGALQQDTRWNVGALYRWKGFDFTLNYQRGNTVGFGVSYRLNMHTVKQQKIVRPPMDITDKEPAADVESVNKQRLVSNLVTNGGFVPNDLDIDETSATIYGVQTSYRDNEEAIERVGRILASEMPESVKEYHIVEHTGNHLMVDTVVDADEFKQHAKYEVPETDLPSTYYRTSPDAETRENFTPKTESGMLYGAEFFWTQSIGNPEAFYMYQAGLMFTGGYQFNRNFGVYGTVSATLLENFDKFNFKVDNEESALPRVRTQTREYVTNGVMSMNSLYGNWFDTYGDDWYYAGYAGYLETMYAGVGAEVMYRPLDSRWAFGIDANFVQQRDFENEFGLLDYKAFTGFASVYWQPEILPDARIRLSAGQFLARDKGVNIEFAKRFDSGIVVGAFASFTNVSAEEYGEGSFTKGFFISVPFDLFVLKPATGRGTFPWIPIARDGGQMLNRPVNLISTTEKRSPFFD
ncbi:YjbH domain-containing protein [Marisediminitalea sp.]|uniref:YjbH domain-containing protein n=1 Tax=Marisediminitalea sp. TaxID=2662268 RepID=UPI003511E90D